ncbi:3766_t:CDS:2 [Rhizophagus irregularis]|nr:3766_t:CDS:2 [Rhizophagus irregularis]
MSMSDIESMSSDSSNSDLLLKNFLNDSDLSDNEVCFINTAETNTNLTLEENVRNLVIRHPKGRPPGNTRFKRPLEISNDSNKITNGRNQNKCSYCSNKRHNHTTCSSNPVKRKKE